MSVLSTIHAYLVTGALSKGWGGPVCRAAVPFNVHIYESIAWLTVAVLAFNYFNVASRVKSMSKSIKADLLVCKHSSFARTFELVMCVIHFAMFAQIIYYKLNIMSLANMIQPCHVILLLQGIALLSTNSTGVFITVFILPALTGTLSAMLFPDTGGLDQPFEMDAYWIQHYIIQAVPLYLLCRRNFLALKYTSWFTVFMGLWILLVLHFSLFEVWDLMLDVNVEFMLCPTDAMVYIFGNVPSVPLWPSYRTTLTVAVILIAFPLSYSYIIAGHLLKMVLGRKNKVV